ncbi:MAG TPA: ComEC/Rec2 family competence protein [Candidatus Acidoferrales bacterium]|nr:ComEC/Rec2 family competence protein [Candidatus Acidoferrales bacterium]
MKYIKIIVVCIALLLSLAIRFQQFYNSNPPYHAGQKISLTTTLQQEPDETYKGQKFSIKTPTNQLISVSANTYPRYHYGQVVVVSGRLQAYTFPDGQTILTLYRPAITLQKEANNPVAAAANAVRAHTRLIYKDTLPPISASLLMGMIFGANEKFPDSFRQALQTTGVLHVIAASGMNVTFISAALLFTLGLFLKRRPAIVIGGVSIIFYVFLVGFQPSILRASIMGLLAFGAALFGRQHIAVVALFVSGYVLLLWKPNYLFDVGFQLSFMATVGIMFLKPLLDRPLVKLGKIGEFGGETVTTTLAAQLGTLPILLSVFGQFGLLSILVNALVLWTIPFIMVIGSIAAIIGLLFPFVGHVFLYPVYPFLLYFETVVSFFGTSGWVIHTSPLPMAMWIGYYLLLGSVVLLQKRKLQIKNEPILQLDSKDRG